MRRRKRNAVDSATPPVISAETGNLDLRCTWSADVVITAGSAGDAGKEPKRPRIAMKAYNGGPMRLEGWRFPVQIDGAGVRFAAENIPFYVFHEVRYLSPADRMEQLIGQSDKCSVEGGAILAEGFITGTSDTCKAALDHASNGFKWQASINAQPSRAGIEFVPEGETRQVNGRSVMGPLVIARSVVLDHIALVPLGADTSTSVSIAAQAAQEKQTMEFEAWLKAEYGLDAASLSDEQRQKFQARFQAHAAGKPDKGGSQEPAAPPPVSAGAPKRDADDDGIAAARKARATEARRIAKIDQLQAEYRKVEGVAEICAKAIEDGTSATDVELALLRASRKPSASDGADGLPNIQAGRGPIPKDGLGEYRYQDPHRGGRFSAQASGTRINDDLCRVAEAGALISCGYSADRLSKNGQYGERVVDAAERYMPRGVGPLGLMRIVARYAGIQLSENKEDAYNEIVAEFGALSLPAILSNVMNKLLLDAYTAVDPDHAAADGSIAWKKFCKRGPVQDFKPHYRVRLTSDMTFQTLGPTGEIQKGQVSEQSYSLQADTRAIMFGLSRKTIINDDLSAMSALPQHFGIGAGETVAKFIYGLLLANTQAGYQSDGSTAFFSSAATTTRMAKKIANLLTSSALSLAKLQAAYEQFMGQTKPSGAPLGVMPRVLLVPPGLVILAKQLYQSTELIAALVSTSGSPTGQVSRNVLAGLFQPVCSSYLIDSTITGYSAACLTNWYLMSAPTDVVYPVEVGFLNGQEMPIVERDDMDFDRLGIAFRGILDFGGNLAEPRAAVLSQA